MLPLGLCRETVKESRRRVPTEWGDIMVVWQGEKIDWLTYSTLGDVIIISKVKASNTSNRLNS